MSDNGDATGDESDDSMVGLEIAEIRRLTDAEVEREGWGHSRGANPPVLVLEDGTKLYPSADPEGNRGGALFGAGPGGDLFFVNPPEPEGDE